MLPKLRTLLVSTLLSLLATAITAQNTIHVPADQPTIQAGINAANTGDTVLVSPGTYYENIDFKGKAITVTSSGGATATIIDGGTKGPAVSFKTSETRSTVLSNFTIQHGGVFDYTVFVNGGIYLNNSAPTILNNTLTQNNCWTIYSTASAPLIQGNEISATQDPKGQCSFGGGAGIYVSGNLNYATAPSRLTSPLIYGNTIENNVESGLEDAGGNGGAGIAVWGGTPLVENNIIRNNSSPGGSGGAINFQGGGGSVVQNLIYNNQAGCGGGAIAFLAGGIGSDIGLVIANNTIVNNTGQNNAGYSECIAISQIYPSPDAYGTSGPAVVLVNNIISGSTSEPAVDCSWFGPKSEASQPIFDHNILNNAGGAFFGSYCIDVSAKYGNIAADPQFINLASNDFHLTSTSPAIDAGNNSALQSVLQLSATSISQDFDANPRVLDATHKGYPIIDIGAYEFAGSVDATPTTIVLTSSAYTGNAGSGYTLTAALASALGDPTGSVTFFLDNKSIGTSPINSGVATLSNFLLTPGVHSLYATYPGQGTFTPAISVIIIVDISLYTTTLSLTSSPNPSNLGQPVTFTVTASAADNTIPSPITLTDNSTNTLLATLTPNSSGVATYTISTLAVGSHSIEAYYAGDSTHRGFSITIVQNVINPGATTTTLTSSPNPSTYGQPATFTATVSAASATPTGSVIFTERGTTLATVPLTTAGTAQFTTSSLTANDPGTTPYHQISAGYAPTGSFGESYASIDQIVNGLPSNTNLVVTPASGTTSTSFTLTATVTSATSTSTITPTGSVLFYSSAQTGIPGNEVGYAVLVNGVATLATSGFLGGSDYVIGIYFGDTIYASSTSNYFTLTVTAPPTVTLTSSLNPAPALTPITFTAQVPAGDAGTVVFNINGQNVTTTPNAAGISTTTISTLTQGSYLITASFYASGHALATQASLTQVITAPLAVPDFSLNGTNVTFKALHSGTGQLELASINNFSGTVALTCDPPYPANYACTLQNANIQLPAGGSAVVNFMLTPNYTASTRSQTRFVLAALFPLTLLSLIGLTRKRRTLRALLSLVVLAILAATTTACGPDHFIPITTGTFPITFTGTSNQQIDPPGTPPIIHTVTITSTITP